MQTPTQPGPDCECQTAAPLEQRRGFLAKTAAVFAGALAYATPAALGVYSFLNPLRKRRPAGQSAAQGASEEGGLRRVASLDAVPEDGTPQMFPVIADRTDAWNRFPNEPIGAVFLRRTGKDQVEAIQVVCPHQGCSIEYVRDGDGQAKAPAGKFFCPCHKASFDLGGERLDKVSPSPRDLDKLDEVEIREGGEIWVKFRNFRCGIPEKVVES